MTGDDVEHRIDSLYALPLDDFTEARNALANELRGAGQRDAALTVKSLRKPSLTAWAVNQIVHHYPEVLRATVEATTQVREAHAEGPRGLSDAMEARKSALAAAVREASGVLSRSGHPPNQTQQRRVSGTLDALSSDAAEGLPGRLTKDLEPLGFSGLTGLQFAPPRVRPRAPTAARSSEAAKSPGGGAGSGLKSRTTPRAASRASPETEATANRDREAAQKALRKKVQAAISTAKSKVVSLERKAKKAAETLRRADEVSHKAAHALEAARAVLEQAQQRAEAASVAETESRSRVESLRGDKDQHDLALARGHQALRDAEGGLSDLA